MGVKPTAAHRCILGTRPTAAAYTDAISVVAIANSVGKRGYFVAHYTIVGGRVSPHCAKGGGWGQGRRAATRVHGTRHLIHYGVDLGGLEGAERDRGSQVVGSKSRLRDESAPN